MREGRVEILPSGFRQIFSLFGARRRSRASGTHDAVSSGRGILAAALLDRFPKATAHASDVSDEMLAKAPAVLAGSASLTHLSCQNMHDRNYLNDVVAGPVGLIVSCLAVHHCDDAEKQSLYRSAFEKLSSPGALLILDVVKPTSPLAHVFTRA